MEPEESTETDASAPSEAPRKRVPRPKPPVIDENDVPAETAEPDRAAELETETPEETKTEDETATEDLAQAEGTTGDAIDTAALDAVSEAPASFAAPGATSTPSVNGVKAPPQSTGTVTPSAFPAPAARTKRVAPALGIAALAVLIILRRRRRR